VKAEVDGLRNSSQLQKWVPHVWDYKEINMSLKPGGVVADSGFVAVALMERIAFSWDELVDSMRFQELVLANLRVVAEAAVKVIRSLFMMAEDGLPCYDLHGRNLAFADTGLARLVIVDWQGEHNIIKHTVHKRMKRAIPKFVKGLPGQSVWMTKKDLPNKLSRPKEAQERVPHWVKFYGALGDIILRKWETIHESKNENAFQLLRCDLNEVCVKTATDLPQHAPAALSVVSEVTRTEISQSSSDSDESPSKTAVVDLVSEAQSDADAAVPDAAAELLQGSVGPQTTTAVASEPVPVISGAANWPFQLGREALVGLSKACAQQIEHIQANPIRHARVTLKSKVIEQRVADDDFSAHAKRPFSTDQHLGDVFSLLVRVVQSELLECGLLERCQRGVPKSASDPKKLHQGRLLM
jgi:hypothetical protein